MLETIREYALERLEGSGEAAGVRRRHAAWFADLAEAAEPELKGPGQAEWLPRLERDHDNLRAALAWALDGGEVETAARIGASVWLLWWMHGHMTEGRAWLERIVERDAGLPPALRSRVLNAGGGLAYQQGDHQRAVLLLEEALALARSTGDELAISRSLGNLGIVLSEQGDRARAMALYEEGLEIALWARRRSPRRGRRVGG